MRARTREQQWGDAAMVIANASGVGAWMGVEEQEAAIEGALANAPDDETVKAAAETLRTWRDEGDDS